MLQTPVTWRVNCLMGSIIIVSGPVGAGKTTVAKALVASPERPTVYLEGDSFWSHIKQEHAGPRLERFRSVMRAMLATAVSYARSEYEVVLDFSIPPQFLERAFARLRDVEIHYVVLRPSAPVCSARAGARIEGAIADYAEYRDFYDAFASAARYTIPDDDCDALSMAARIREGVSAGRFRYGDTNEIAPA